MTAKRSLRNRVAVTLGVFGSLVSVALASIIYLASHDLERRLVDETLAAELDDYIARRSRNPQSLPESTATIRAFVVAQSGGTTPVPDAVAALDPGSHRLVLDDTPYRAAVRAVGDQRFVVLYDVSALQRREHGFLALLATSVLVITAISALAGRWLAARTIAPVTELARQVAERRPEDSHEALASQFPWEEVQRLAADFDSYLGRLHDFIERERMFTGDVSHELRTPLAVIKGAAELMLAEPAMDEKLRGRAARIERAVTEMEEISGALLALAREKDPTNTHTPPCDVEGVAAELVSRYQTLFRGKPVELSIQVCGHPKVHADRAVLAMVLGNLLRNAMSYTDSGSVHITLEKDSISLEDTGRGLGDRDVRTLFHPYVRGENSSGAGLGLSLVQRLCQRQGWTVMLENRPQGGTLARLLFDPANALA